VRGGDSPLAGPVLKIPYEIEFSIAVQKVPHFIPVIQLYPEILFLVEISGYGKISIVIGGPVVAQAPDKSPVPAVKTDIEVRPQYA
jgi:hypothetical protein